MAGKCFACHGDDPEDIEGEFNMLTRESMLKGGDYFAEEVLMPGKGEESYLYITTTRTEEDYEMPPKEADQLSEEQQLSIRDWINEGAPWPDEERVAMIQDKFAEGVQVKISKALSDEWQNRRYERKKLWAYHPLTVEDVQEGKNHPIGSIDGKLADADIKAAPDAEAIELVRRMSFGLTGLPPKPEVVEKFVANYGKAPGETVESFADELMATPHYGERFAGALAGCDALRGYGWICERLLPAECVALSGLRGSGVQ